MSKKKKMVLQDNAPNWMNDVRKKLAEQVAADEAAAKKAIASRTSPESPKRSQG